MKNSIVLGLLTVLAAGSAMASTAPDAGAPLDDAGFVEELPADDATLPMSGSCSGLTIRVKNNSDRAIKVTKIGYRVPGGTWHTEGLSNKRIDEGGAMAEWSGQNLQHSNENTGYNFRVYYQKFNGSSYGAEEFQFFNKESQLCRDGGQYTFWVTE